MAKRLFALSVLVIAALVALGLWVTESDDGPETAASGFYLGAVAVALGAGIAAGVFFTISRRGRP